MLAPATPMASRMAVGLWAGKLSRMTASLGTSVWGLDISEEGGAVHGPVDGHGRHHAIKCQASNNARRLPIAMRNQGTAALASRCAAILSGSLG